MNLDKSYPHLFELLWYSQLPCFDIVNVTTKANEDHGKSQAFKFFTSITVPSDHNRHDKEMLVEGQTVELF